MIVRILCLHVVLSFFVIPGLIAKPVSLNELIEAEEKQRSLSTTTPTPKLATGILELPPFKEPKKVTSAKSKKLSGKTGKGLLKKPFSLKEILPEISQEKPKKISKAPKQFSLDRILKHRTDRIKKLFGKGLTKKPLYLIDEELVVEESKGIGKSAPAPETTERFSPDKVLKPKSAKSKLKRKDNILPRGRKISSLKFRKIFEIESPLKQNKIKDTKRERSRRKTQSSKREISNDVIFDRKYIPLLKSLNMLFDDIMVPDYDNSEEFERESRKGKDIDTRNNTCTCGNKFNAELKPSTIKETITSTTSRLQTSTAEPTTTEIATTTTHHTTDGNVSSVGHHTDLPPILAGDTACTQRDNNGISTGSSPPFHSSIERDITRDNRDNEHDTGSGPNSASTKSNKENTDSTPRNDSSSFRFGRGRDGTEVRRPVFRRGIDDRIDSTEGKESFRNVGRDLDITERQDKHEVGGDEAESSVAIPKFVRGERRFISEDQVGYNSEQIQPEKGNEESDDNDRLHLSDDQRITIGNGTLPTEDQKFSPTNAVISISDLSNPVIMLQNNPKHKSPYVTIIDGYSIARDKNGSNKIAEQSIRIHS